VPEYDPEVESGRASEGDSVARLIARRLEEQSWNPRELLALSLLIAVLLIAIADAVQAIWGGLSNAEVAQRVSGAFQWTSPISAAIVILAVGFLWWHSLDVCKIADEYAAGGERIANDPLDPYARVSRTMWLGTYAGVLLLLDGGGAIVYTIAGRISTGPLSASSGDFTAAILITLATVGVALAGLVVVKVIRKECLARLYAEDADLGPDEA
jgi:hypothetical protein